MAGRQHGASFVVNLLLLACLRWNRPEGEFAGIVKPDSSIVEERGNIGADPAVTFRSTCRLAPRVGFFKGFARGYF